MSNRFDAKLQESDVLALRSTAPTTLQLNVGKLCNQACKHCHVDAGPHQTGADVNMAEDIVDAVLAALTTGSIKSLDLTGGAPELNPHFRRLVREARALGVHVMDRCNLSILLEPGHQDLAAFLAEHQVEVVASLPFYRRDRTDRQRGTGVFDRSIEAMRLLNSLGYGDGSSGLLLNLVYNPVGAYLPADQRALEADYKRELRRLFDIVFDHLYCITNMPIARFLEWLRRSELEEEYMQKLLDAFNPGAVDGLMCRDMVSVGPDGSLYDCDFNQMLGLPLDSAAPRNIRDWTTAALAGRAIITGDHCLGCTAGAGSSCGGATA